MKVPYTVSFNSQTGVKELSWDTPADYFKLIIPHLCGISQIERVRGIEPLYLAWKASARPLCYTRIFNDSITFCLFFQSFGIM